jgi:glutamate-1-semialdehyde 2,1-aminomutase
MITATSREASVRAKTPGSWERYQRACRSLAGGVSTALRRNARPYPLYFDHAQGCRMTDVDGNVYLDYGLAWGPLILGHAHPAIVEAVSAAAARGMTFGAQHDLEFEVAERLCEILPCADLVVYSNSGTEIVQVALRLARTITGKPRYLRFEGHYHGWMPHDGSLLCPWNDRDAVAGAMRSGDVAAIIAEPMLANGGCIPAQPGFLRFLREAADRAGALLIFDEVITGFRLALGGAQEFYGVLPDLATYAKAVGAGAPLSVLAGREDCMGRIARGEVMHAGTLNGNPVSLAAAMAALRELSTPGAFDRLHAAGRRLRQALTKLLPQARITGEDPVFAIHFASREAYSDFALALLDEGVLVLPDGRWYLSMAHSPDDIDQTISAAETAARSL